MTEGESPNQRGAPNPIQAATGPPNPTTPTRAPGPRPTTQRSNVMRLVVVVAAIIALAVATGHGALLIVVLAIVAMIMLHELGHFATAKWAGMKVTEYFLGFGPRLWSVRRGETEYGIKAIPAGGYVKIVGMTNLEHVPQEDEGRTYRQAPFWRRLSVAVAGSTVHFILAFVLLWSVFALVGTASTSRVVVVSLSKLAHGTSPAQRAGMQAGDVIVSVNGHKAKALNALDSVTKSQVGKPVSLVVSRHGRNVILHVTPVPASSITYASSPAVVAPAGGPTGSEGVIGVTTQVQRGPPLVRSNPFSAVAQGANDFGLIVSQSVIGIGQIFSPHGISNYVSQVAGSGGHKATASPAASANSANNNRLVSIVGAARLATQAAHAGIGDLLLVLSDINIFIGLANMFPLLPLDGGHVVIAIYERLRSRRARHYHADVAKLLPATYVMFIFLVVIGVSAFYLDIAHPLPNLFN